MNTPPQTRNEIIKKIVNSSDELSVCKAPDGRNKHPLGGYCAGYLKAQIDDHYAYYEVESILMDLEEYRPYYTQNHPFNQPDAIADFEWWAKKPYWTLDEAIALLFGKNPAVVNWESVNQADVRFVPFVADYIKITELAERYKNIGELSDQIKPCEFLEWAQKMQLSVPHDLLEKLSIIKNPSNSNNFFDKYTTPLLDILNKAIEKFWINYDSNRPPKSEDIKKWIEEQGAAKRVASVMDSIMRPESLKKGGNRPRNQRKG